MMRNAGLLIAVLALSSCGKPDNASGPGGVTVGEARALDEAAEMLEKRRMPPEALRPAGPPAEAAAPTPAQTP